MKRLLLALLVLGIVAPQEAPYRVPNPDHVGHFRRPDGARCATKGEHPCDCAVVHRERGHGGALAVRMSDRCQWYCDEDHCDCHPCPQGECAGR